MTTLQTTPEATETVADLLERLGDIAPARIRLRPALGTATESDLVEVNRRGKPACELVEGVLVEKLMSYRESLLAVALSALLHAFVTTRNLGLVSGADGMMRLFPGLVRIPDIAYVSWDRVPGRRVPEHPIADFAPDLAIEVLSPGNTKAEMTRKRLEYFSSGVQILWLIDPVDRTITVFTGPQESSVLGDGEILEGGMLLPGFQVPVHDLFAYLDRQGE